MTTILNSRVFNQDIAGAKRAAQKGPVVVTDRGEPAYVLMTHAEYKRLRGNQPSIAELLAHPESEHIDFDPPRLGGLPARPIDFD